MPSVSNIAIGANMAAAAANKARHGMNESIARLSTGVRAMYGADAAGHSMGKSIQAVGASYAQALVTSKMVCLMHKWVNPFF